MDLSQLRLPVAMQIVPGVTKDVLLSGQDGIDRMEYRNDVVVFRVNGRGVAILWVPLPGTVMIRGDDAPF